MFLAKAWRALGMGLVVGALAGCAHYPVNDALGTPPPAVTYRFPDAAPGDTNSDSLLVCLTFSGGGTRAAAIAYGVMEELRQTPIQGPGGATTLLGEVDCISSVSGGSFAAAYYGLFGGRLFEDFRARFLDRDIQGELARQLLNPVTLARLASPYFSRSDLAAELYDRTIFDHRTFASLTGHRPFVILNATDLATGSRFEFTQEQFDLLGSDIGPYPVARAVAASSAFPLLLTPVSLQNRPQPAGWQPPQEYQDALTAFGSDRRRWAWARSRLDYVTRKQERLWVHLGDGGMADNIGLRPLDAAYRFSSGFILPRINRRQVQRIVIIAVNAHTDPQEQISRKASPPGALAVAFKATTIAMDNYSFDSIQLMKDLQAAAEQARDYVATCQDRLDGYAATLDARCAKPPPRLRAPARLRGCLVQVDFEALTNDQERQHFLNLPTTFALPRQDVDDLIAVGHRLLRESPDFQRLLRALAGSPPSADAGEDPNCQ